MKPDKDIKAMFDRIDTCLDDNDAFLQSLEERLDKVECIRTTQDTLIRRYRASMLSSLVCGLVIGAGSVMALKAAPPAVMEKLTFLVSRIPDIPVLGEHDPVFVVNAIIFLFMGTAAFWITRNLKECLYSAVS